METTSAILRRYIDLLEQETTGVAVSVERYVGIDQPPAADSPFPTDFTFEVDRDEKRDTVTQMIKAEIQASTGYEPAKFVWRWVAVRDDAGYDEQRVKPRGCEAGSPKQRRVNGDVLP